jgi:hypothetical protein
LLVVGAAEDDVVGGGVVLGAGAEVEGAGVAEYLLEAPGDPEPASEFPAAKMTMFAVPPAGMVTTQKFAPPAPEAESALVTPP